MFSENGWFPERDGLTQFGPIFASHLPLDVVVIMLGTNDLNSKTHHQPNEIAKAIDGYKEKMQFWCDFMKYGIPKLVIIAPPEIDEEGLDSFREVFEGSALLVSELRDSLEAYAQTNGDIFLDASEVVVSKNTDGIHLDAAESRKLGQKIAGVVKGAVA
jgi:lysophospholipase L1-like esterase